MAGKDRKTKQDQEDTQAPNRSLAIVAVVLGVSLVLLLTVGGVYWLVTERERDVDLLSGRGGTPAERIDCKPGALADWNVLLISADTTRADRVGCYGNTEIRTPVIDGLAREGILFLQAVTPVPITLPGHTTMLTGLNPYRHGVRSNGLFKLNESVETMATLLKKHGYSTGAAVGAYVLDEKFGLSRGFDDYDDDLHMANKPSEYAYPERPAEVVNAAAIEWLRAKGKSKFFLFVHYFDPHSPYAPPTPYDERYPNNPYDGEIAYVDSQVGSLLAALDTLGVRERTLVIFTSDHGESVGEHGERTHALFVYDATQHIPLLFNAPKALPRNRVVARQAGLVDILPTTLALLGLPCPENLDGRSLLDEPPEGLRTMYLETLYPRLTHNWAALFGLRRLDYKYIHAPQPELYDLRADPRELNNLALAKPDVAAELRGQLREMLGGDWENAAEIEGNLAVDAETRAKLESLGYVVRSSSQPAASTQADTSLPDPKEMIRAARILVEVKTLTQEGHYQQAEEKVQRYLDLSPNDGYGRVIAGDICLKRGRLEEALEHFKIAVRHSYKPSVVWAKLGSAYVQLKRFEEAREAYEESLAIDPHGTMALIGMGAILSEEGRFDEAMKYYQDVLAYGNGRNAGTAYLGLSNVFRKKGQTEKADALLSQAVRAEPSNPVIMGVASGLSAKSGKPTWVVEQLRTAAEERPTAEVLLSLGTALNEKKQYQEAEQRLRQALTLAPKNAQIYYQLGVALQNLNNIQPAGQAYLKATQIDANHGKAYQSLGVLFARAGQFPKSLTLLQRAVELEPQSYEAHFNLGLVQANLKAYDKAIARFQQALKLNPRSAVAHCKWGAVLSLQGKRSEAIAHYRKALEIDPNNAEAKKELQSLGVQP